MLLSCLHTYQRRSKCTWGCDLSSRLRCGRRSVSSKSVPFGVSSLSFQELASGVLDILDSRPRRAVWIEDDLGPCSSINVSHLAPQLRILVGLDRQVDSEVSRHDDRHAQTKYVERVHAEGKPWFLRGGSDDNHPPVLWEV